MPSWIADHFVLVVGTLAIVSVVVTLLAVRATFRRARRLERKFRPWAAFVACLALLIVGAAATVFLGTGLVEMWPQASAQKQLLGKPAPELAFHRVADEVPETLAAHRGNVVLVNLWATWCPPCIAEMPELDRLQQEYAERGLVVLQISDEPREKLVRYLEKSPMSTHHGYLERFPWPEFGRPTTFVVDREGVVRQAFSGQRPYEVFEERISDYL